MRNTINVSVTKHWKEFIADQLKRGRFFNRSEIIRAGLKLLETEDQLIFKARTLTIELEASLAAAKKLPNQAAPAKKPAPKPKK